MPDPVAQTSSTTTGNPPPPVAPSPKPGMRPSRDPATRGNVLAGLEKLTDASMAAPEDKPAQTEPPKTEEPAPEPAKPADAEPEVDSDADDEQREQPEPAKVEAKPGDAEHAKRAAAVQKLEKRAREQIAKERAELEAKEKQIAERAATVERWEQLAKRAKHDPAAVLAALGLSDEDYEHAARQIYARSPAAKAKPETREAADRAAREREHGDKLETALKQIDELRSEIKTRDERAVQQQAAERYVASVAKAINAEESPLVANLYGKNPERARYEFGRVAIALAERDGDTPEPADVIAELERQRRADLEESGVDVAAYLKGRKPAAPVEKPRALADTRSATPTAPKAAQTYKDKKRDVLKALEAESVVDA